MEVYFYIPTKHAENAVDCGLKLSEWYSREVVIDGVNKKCLAALLNPRDDYEKYVSTEYKCLKLEVHPKYCYVADGLLYSVGLANPEAMEMYRRSIVPIEKYTFGDYRLPEVLVSCTVLGDQVSIAGRGLDSPLLYDNSRELYFNNLLETMREKYDDLNDTLFYLFFKKLSDEGKARCIEDHAVGVAVFAHEKNGRVYTFKIPDLSKY